jgi:hypothetical protein
MTSGKDPEGFTRDPGCWNAQKISQKWLCVTQETFRVWYSRYVSAMVSDSKGLGENQ